jgi:hypothetical protein
MQILGKGVVRGWEGNDGGVEEIATNRVYFKVEEESKLM